MVTINHYSEDAFQREVRDIVSRINLKAIPANFPDTIRLSVAIPKTLCDSDFQNNFATSYYYHERTN